MKVVLSRPASRQVERIYHYIAEQRPAAADAFTDALSALRMRLGEQPASAPLIREPNFRQATMTRFPYAVVYRADARQVTILGVFHTARNPSVRSPS